MAVCVRMWASFPLPLACHRVGGSPEEELILDLGGVTLLRRHLLTLRGEGTLCPEVLRGFVHILRNENQGVTSLSVKPSFLCSTSPQIPSARDERSGVCWFFWGSSEGELVIKALQVRLLFLCSRLLLLRHS